MGGLFAPKMPKPLPPPARAINAITETPALELVDNIVDKKKRGKKALRTELVDKVSTQVGSMTSGLQIPQGGQ